VWVVCFGTFLNKFGSFVIPFLAIYMKGRGFTLTQAGTAIAAFGAGNLVASGFGGWLADHLGRKKTIVISMLAVAVGMLLLSAARSYTEILVCAALVGFTGELYRPASSALLADLVPEERRVVAYGLYRLAINAGFALGPATAGFLAETSFEWLFWGDALTSLLYGILAIFALPAGVKIAQLKEGWIDVAKEVWRSTTFLHLMIGTFLIAFLFFQLNSTLPVHIQARGLSAAHYGIVLSFNGLLVVVCEMPLLVFIRRLPVRRMIVVGYVLIAVGLTLNAGARTVYEFIGAMVVFTVGEMIALPIAATLVANIAPLRFRGRFMGIYSLVWATGLVWGPTAGLALYGVSSNLLWGVCFGLGLIAALLFAIAPACSTLDTTVSPVTKRA
jgi:MFS family permease